MPQTHRLTLLCGLALGLLALGGFPARGNLGAKIEREIGRQVLYAFESSVGLVDDPLLVEWVQRVGEDIAAVSPRPDVRYVFTITDTDEMNAFAAPGGFIFVTRGLLDEVSSDDELAGVLAHEMGHVVERHGMKQLEKQVLALGLLSTIRNEKYQDLLLALQFLDLVVSLKYSRDLESRADRFGVEHTYRAGYDPAGLVSFFEHLLAREKRSPSRWEVFFSTHPPTQERLDRARLSRWLHEPDYETVLKLGDQHQARYQLRAAEEKFYQAAQQRPNEAAAHMRLANLYALTGDWEMARAAARRAVELAPEDPLAQATWARVQAEPPPPAVIRLPAAEAQALQATVQGQAGAEPTPAERERLEQYRRLVDEHFRMRRDNLLLDEALLIAPRIQDARWLAAVGSVKALLQELDRVLFRAAKIRQGAQQVESDGRRIGAELRQALAASGSEKVSAELAAAARSWETAVRQSRPAWTDSLTEAARALADADSAASLLTPILLDLNNPDRERLAWGHFSLVEAALYGAHRYTRSAHRRSQRAAAQLAQAQARFLLADLDLAKAQAAPAAQWLYDQAAAFRCGLDLDRLQAWQAQGRPFSEAVWVGLLERQTGDPREDLEAARQEGESWVELASRLALDQDALRITLKMLNRQLTGLRLQGQGTGGGEGVEGVKGLEPPNRPREETK